MKNLGMRIERQVRNGSRSKIVLSIALFTLCGLASAQHWVAAPTFPGAGAGAAILMPNGGVLVEEVSGPALLGGTATGNWYVLWPSNTGDYSAGFWGGPVSTSGYGYAPLYFAEAVLPDGHVIMMGGEYNFGSKADINFGALYDGNAGKFISKLGPPPGWSTVGDAPSVVRANGQFMLGDCCSSQQALFHPSTKSWTSTGFGKADPNSEEGWVLLPGTDNHVLTVDTQNGNNSEIFDPATVTWSPGPKLPFLLPYNCGLKIVPEMGPMVLRPNGTVFAAGANGLTAVYNSATNKWSKGPTFPPNSAGLGQDGVADGPAAILPDGNVLVQASNINPCFIAPSDYFEFNGSKLIPVPGPPNASNEASFDGRMVVLPNGGHVLHTDGTPDVEMYIPKGAANPAWAPVVTSYPHTITFGGSYTFKGTQLNGMSQGAAYGDDAQSASNFPLVRVSLNGFTYYLPTKNFSNMGVQTGSLVVTAQFSLPFFIGTGTGTFEVVTNGISSGLLPITVK